MQRKRIASGTVPSQVKFTMQSYHQKRVRSNRNINQVGIRVTKPEPPNVLGKSMTTKNQEHIDTAKEFGTLTGIAFQIKDDLFDFGSDDGIGKPTGIDIKEKKMTLPLIYALNNSSWIEKRKIINYIKNHNEESEKVKEVIDFVIKKGGVEYTKQVMNTYKERALDVLKKFPDSETKNSLEQLLKYAIERKK